MKLRLTLQHGIGLQQLFLDLVHLLALPTHCRHIWHHQLAGLWSRATRMSVGSKPGRGARAACPSLSAQTFLFPHSCSRASERDLYVGDCYCITSPSSSSPKTWIRHCWGRGVFSRMILWIIKRLRSDTPCRMPAGIWRDDPDARGSDPEPGKEG